MGKAENIEINENFLILKSKKNKNIKINKVKFKMDKKNKILMMYLIW